jgi:hypothetical protein
MTTVFNSPCGIFIFLIVRPFLAIACLAEIALASKSEGGGGRYRVALALRVFSKAKNSSDILPSIYERLASTSLNQEMPIIIRPAILFRSIAIIIRVLLITPRTAANISINIDLAITIPNGMALLITPSADQLCSRLLQPGHYSI